MKKTITVEINTDDRTDGPQCPYCGYVERQLGLYAHHGSYRSDKKDEWVKRECGVCDKEYEMFIQFSITYFSTREIGT